MALAPARDGAAASAGADGLVSRAAAVEVPRTQQPATEGNGAAFPILGQAHGEKKWVEWGRTRARCDMLTVLPHEWQFSNLCTIGEHRHCSIVT